MAQAHDGHFLNEILKEPTGYMVGYIVVKLMGTFEKYPPLTHWVNVGRIVSEPFIYSTWTHWVIDPLPPVSARPPPTPPLQSEHHVSVSITSHVSHTVAASSQVSNVVNSTISLPSEQEIGGSSIQTTDPPIQQASPPIEKAPRPIPKKKGPKSSKSVVKISSNGP